jgi:hypothetical protein
MPIIIADTLAPAAYRLGSNDSRRMWEFINKFQANPAQPSISLERIKDGRDENLWAGRVSDNVRAILHKNGEIWTILHVDRHDNAYRWAISRTVEQHVRTGALQIVVMPEVVEAQLPAPTIGKPDLFATHTDDYLISLGLPPSWLPLMRKVMDEDTFLSILPNLPEEVQERLLSLASGELVTPPVPPSAKRSVLENEDTKRRFFVLEDNNDLALLLDAPLATWIAFLHPSQRRLATGRFNGPLKVTGSAGTGKTVVALHRARHLARQGKRILLTTYVGTLCNNLDRNLRLLCDEAERQNIHIATVHSQAVAILKSAGRNVFAIYDDEIADLIPNYASIGVEVRD